VCQRNDTSCTFKPGTPIRSRPDAPHVHYVVTGGGLSPDGRRWIACRSGFFLPVRVLSRFFRGLSLHGLKEAYAAHKLQFHGSLQPPAGPGGFKTLSKACRKIEWVVYSKPPFGGPDQVLDYLGRCLFAT
jgi:hypothetical protein